MVNVNAYLSEPNVSNETNIRIQSEISYETSHTYPHRKNSPATKELTALPSPKIRSMRSIRISMRSPLIKQKEMKSEKWLISKCFISYSYLF
jgi:hypothetical protein